MLGELRHRITVLYWSTVGNMYKAAYTRNMFSNYRVLGIYRALCHQQLRSKARRIIRVYSVFIAALGIHRQIEKD